jgi:hypothetical protein
VNISEDHADSTLKMEGWYLTTLLHGVTTKKTMTRIFIAAKTSNLTTAEYVVSVKVGLLSRGKKKFSEVLIITKF